MSLIVCSRKRAMAHASVLLLLPGALVLVTSGEAQAAPSTRRVSVSSAGAQANNESFSPSVSTDGSVIAFDSYASNLVASDTNRFGDVFVRNATTNRTKRVSVSTAGAQANQQSSAPSISGDGSVVAFVSTASNLVAGDTNGFSDVFVRDLTTNKTRRVSVSSAGAQANSPSSEPSISTDGRFVAFASTASNLVAGDTNDFATDIFVRNLTTNRTSRVNVSSAGAQANFVSRYPSISADGSIVAFHSDATNLVAGDTNGSRDVFVRDRATSTTRRVSVTSAGAQANASSSYPSISADGSIVAFESFATNLVSGDTNGKADVFIRNLTTNRTRRVSVSSAGAQANANSSAPSISANGRFVAFPSFASNLAGVDNNGGLDDVFVRDFATNKTRRVSVSSGGASANGESSNPSISGDGRYVAYHSYASNLVGGDTNGKVDIFRRGPLF